MGIRFSFIWINIMKPPISLEELRFRELPKSAQKDYVQYTKHRVKELAKSLAECKNRKEFSSFEYYICGRLTEAEEILEMLKYIKKVNKNE